VSAQDDTIEHTERVPMEDVPTYRAVIDQLVKACREGQGQHLDDELVEGILVGY
jgi:hypothetical protein